MVITSTLNPNDKVTDEQLKELERAKQIPITYDDDSPELSDGMMKAFKLAAQSRDRYKSIS